MKRKGRKAPKKEEVAEDWCFVCKDGGNLFLCDHKHCLKAYHSHCVGKNDSFMTSDQHWNCNWHCCFMCPRKSCFHCYCCPNAVCRFCMSDSEFLLVRGMQGFCNTCLKLAMLIEQNMDVDSDGETVDFKDQETYEGLFMDYYKMVQHKEGFTIDDIRAAIDRVKTGNSDPDDFGHQEESEMESEYNEEEEDLKQHLNNKASKGKPALKQKNVKSNVLQFTGWGSTPLIQFLQSIGKDASEKLPERTVEAIINKYISEHKLFHPEKKRKIICDENLRSIFGRKFINKNRIYELLEAHYSDNLEGSEEEEEETCYSGCNDEDALVTCRTRRESKKEKECRRHDTGLTAPQSPFASITAENIKLVYLRRSLIMELSKQPELFENKVKGSIIRVKSDPDDYSRPKNSFQLVQVTGIKESSMGENATDMVLCSSNMPLEIRMTTLSDGDFSPEECEDLRLRVKDGLVQKPTVVELQQKARSLHEDITNHEIARELKILEGRIIHAIEKGRRQELFEFMERRKKLQTPSERLKLLENYHAVIPEELEPVIEEIVHDQKGDETLPESVFSINLNSKWRGKYTSSMVDSEVYQSEKKWHGSVSSQYEKQNLPEVPVAASPNQSASTEKNNNGLASTLEGSPEQLLASEYQFNRMLQTNAELCSSPVAVARQNHGKDAEDNTSRKQEPFVENVIELSSDDESCSSFGIRKQNLEDPYGREWLISCPNGERNNQKYSLSLLKRWSEASPYAFKYKVWKENESEENAIPLADAVKQAFTG